MTLGLLAAGVGHDLGNVLVAMRVHLAVAARTTRRAEARQRIDAVRHELQYLHELAEGLQTISDADGRRGASSTNLRQWWAEVARLMSAVVPASQRVVASIGQNLPNVAVSRVRLTQAVLNLVINASQAVARLPSSRARRGEISVSVNRVRAPGGLMLKLTVRDKGPGMSVQDRRGALRRLAQPLRGDLASGLGLRLVGWVVRDAGGRAEVESVEGRGSKISLLLPVVRPVACATAN